MTPSRLAHHLGLSRSATTTLLDRLERAGFVRREHDPIDRRRVIVRVDQERVRRLAAPLYGSRVAHMQRVWPHFSEKEPATVAAFFEAVTEEAAEAAESYDTATER